MNLEIKKLVPELAEEYLRFFDTTPHSTNQAEHRCYCVCWCAANCELENFSNAEDRQLLERVSEDAQADGFDIVEAYPNKEFINTEDDFMGPIQLYKRLGFSECYETEKKFVMRKEL